MQRRAFLTNSVRALAGMSALGFATARHHGQVLPPVPSSVDPNDEDFWSLVREHFPLTRDRIYLNTGGLGASPFVSIETVKGKIDELEKISETGHSETLWHATKSSAAQLLGCDADELAFTRNTTEGVNVVCNGLPLKKGDEVITSTHEHVGNTVSWLARQRRDGIVMRVFEPSMHSAEENVERIARLITKKTKVLSISHVTTATGQILPVKKIGEFAKAHNFWYFIDGAQSVGMMPLNVHEIGCHAYATSGHKWLIGPKGTGLLYVRRDALDLVEAKWVGAYSNTGDLDMATGQFQFNPSAQRYEYGTVSAPLVAGLGAAMDFLLAIGLENVWQRVHALAAKLKQGLNERGAEVLSPQHPDEHSAMITFRLSNIKRPQLQQYLSDEFKLRTRGIYEGGLEGIRISPHLYNSFAEIDTVLAAVEAAKEL